MPNTINRKHLYDLVFQQISTASYPVKQISFLKFITKITPKIHFDHTLFEDMDSNDMFPNFCQLDDFQFHSLINEIIYNRDIFVFNLSYEQDGKNDLENIKDIDYKVPISRNDHQDIIRKYILDEILTIGKSVIKDGLNNSLDQSHKLDTITTIAGLQEPITQKIKSINDLNNKQSIILNVISDMIHKDKTSNDLFVSYKDLLSNPLI